MTKEGQIIYPRDDDEISIKELVLSFRKWCKYLYTKKYVIILLLIIGGILGYLFAHFSKPTFIATTTFVLEDEKSGGGLGNLAGLASIAGVDIGGGGGIFQGDNILQLYKSRKILEQTLLTEISYDGKDELLIDYFIRINNKKEHWIKNTKLQKVKFFNDSVSSIESNNKNGLLENRLRDSLLGEVVIDINKNYLVVTKPDKKLSTIQVEVKSKDEVFAKLFNDELVKNVNQFYITTKTKKTLQNVRILQHKTDSVRDEMNGAIYRAVAVADATPNLNPTRQIQRVAPAQRAQFSAETNKAILAEMAKNLEISKMSLLKETPLIQIIDQPIYPLRIDKVGKIKATLMGAAVFSILALVYFIVKKVYKNLINE